MCGSCPCTAASRLLQARRCPAAPLHATCQPGAPVRLPSARQAAVQPPPAALPGLSLAPPPGGHALPPARADAPCCRAQERRRLRMLHAVERVDGTMVARRSLGCCEVQRASRRGSRWLSGARRTGPRSRAVRYRAPICVLSVLLCLLMSYNNTYELLY